MLVGFNFSFEILGFSDSVKTELKESGELIFTFDNIMLPDSNINEPESHGFIKYSISPKNTLFPGQTIKNTANIYFDFNPAIITNTTFNKIKCEEKNYFFQAKLIDGKFVSVPGENYQWYENDNLLANETKQTIKPKDGVNYRVEVEDKNGCKFSSSQFSTDSYLAITNKKGFEAVLYPNPMENYLWIDTQIKEKFTLNMYNINGALVLTSQISQDISQINVSSLKPGLYFAVLKSNQHSITAQLIKK